MRANSSRNNLKFDENGNGKYERPRAVACWLCDESVSFLYSLHFLIICLWKLSYQASIISLERFASIHSLSRLERSKPYTYKDEIMILLSLHKLCKKCERN